MKPIIAVPATALLVYRAYSRNSLTPFGIVVAALTATAQYVLYTFVVAVHPWNLPFVLLVVFFLAGTRATHVKKEVKASLTVSASGSSGGEGPRTHVQVLANSLMATVLTLLHAYQLRQRREQQPESSSCYRWGGDLLVVGIIANYAAVAADTFSSELGILARSEPRLITSWTLRRVPRGTNGGVTLWGLVAGLLGSMIIVTTSFFFLPLCHDQNAGGDYAWTVSQKAQLAWGLTLWGALGSLLDSFLGGWLQRSVTDVRSGKIVEGDGGARVLVSSSSAPEQQGQGQQQHQKATTKLKAKALTGEGKQAVETPDPNARDPYNPQDKHRGSHFGDAKPTRVAESGFDLLDNNDVNFLMAFTMSIGAMVVASWYWGVPMSSILEA